MADYIVTMTEAGVRKRSTTTIADLSGGATSYDFDVASPQTEFTGLTALTSEGQRVDVLVNGWEKREGGGHDYTRNVALTKVVFNNAVQAGAWVRIRVYP